MPREPLAADQPRGVSFLEFLDVQLIQQLVDVDESESVGQVDGEPAAGVPDQFFICSSSLVFLAQ